MFCVCEKLRLLQFELKQINSREFSDVSKRVAEANQTLEILQKDISSHLANPSIISQERVVFKQLLTLLRAEESLAKQKSRIRWMKFGDSALPISSKL